LGFAVVEKVTVNEKRNRVYGFTAAISHDGVGSQQQIIFY